MFSNRTTSTAPMTEKMKPYQERLVALLKDTITLLCRNGLEYDQEFCVEGLLGVTLDKSDVFLIPIKELITDKGVGTDTTVNDTPAAESNETATPDASETSHHRRSRKRHHHQRERSSPVPQAENTSIMSMSQVDFTKKEAVESKEGLLLDSLAAAASRDSYDEQSTPKRQHREEVESEEDSQSHSQARNIKYETEDDDDVVVIKEEIDDQEFASAFQDGSMDSGSHLQRPGHGDASLDFYSHPGTSQGAVGYPLDPMQGPGMQGLPPGVDPDGSWMQQSPGDMQNPDYQQKHQDLQLSCILCGSKFRTKFLLKRHVDGVHYKVRFACDICGKSYTQEAQMKMHRRTIHYDADNLIE